jgi:hypothetical protein
MKVEAIAARTRHTITVGDGTERSSHGVDREIAESLRRSASRCRSTRQLRSVSSYNILNSADCSCATRNRLLLMFSREDVLIVGPHVQFPGLAIPLCS